MLEAAELTRTSFSSLGFVGATQAAEDEGLIALGKDILGIEGEGVVEGLS